MSKISIYEVAPVPKLADKLVGTSVGGEPEDITYNFTLSELLNLFIPNIPGNTLQGVLNFGNTATQNINLTGIITTTTLNVGSTANILNSNLTGQTKITGGLYDRLNSIGTAGQVLRSTGTQVEWYSIPNVIPTLQQVLASGNTADINVILTSNIQALTATANNVVSNTSLSVNGTLKDKDASVGTAGQLLSSTGTKVQWVDLPVYTATSPLSINSITRNISIQQASSTQNGYLSSADWITFDGKQGAVSLTTVGSSGPATLVGSVINVPNYTLSGLGGVPLTRTLTINGVTYNLAADRSWTLATGVSSVTATTPLSSTGGANPNISIQQSSSSLSGYLSSTDWLMFNDKQPAGNYITSLTGEATGAGPGAASVTLSNAAVIGKLLTGLNITGSAISSSDSILTAFGKVQNQINGLIGGVQYQGVWNAATNTPALVSSVGTQGYYYIVSVAGNTNLNGITDWQVGDWAIFNGSTWNKVDNTDLVTSVNGQVGAVSLTTDNIPEGATNLYYLDSRARAALSFAAGSGAYNSTTGVITIPTDNNQILNGAGYITLVSLSATSPLSYNNLTGAFSIQVANTTQNGYLSSADWNTFNGKQNYLNGTGLVKSVAGVISYITDNSANWNTAYNDSIISAAVTGTATKTLTLNQQDGGTITASWSDIDTGLTSVGVSMPAAFSVANSPLTSNGTIAVTGAGTTLQYIDGTGALRTFPGLTGYVPYTGATTNVDLGEFGISAGYFQADLTPTGALQVGRMQWNSTDGTMDLRLMGNNVTLQIGQEMVTRVVNKSGIDLLEANYQVVRIRKVAEGGAQGQRLAVVLAQGNNENNSTEVIGLVTETINNNQEGFVTSLGEVKSINTTGSLQGETWVDGDILYLSSTIAGQLTNVRPVAPNHSVIVGYVVYAHANNGKIYMAIDTGYELGELHNVYAPSPTANQSIYWDTTNSRYQLNTIGGILGYTPANAATTISTTAPLQGGGDLSENRTFSITQSGASTNGYLSSTDWNTFNDKQPLITAGTTLQYYRGDKTFQTLNTTVVPEGTNLYYLDSRARAAISLTTTGSSGAATYNSTTGVFNIPDYGSALSGYVPTSRQLTINGTAYDLSADRSWSVGTVTSVAALTLGTTGTDLSSSVATGTTTPVITLNVPTASAANRGALSAADWSTFNTKVGGVTASSPLASSGGSTPNITIQQSSGSQDGYLSSTDWTTFNSKQVAGNYITSLTGEATATGPGAAAVTLNNASVTGKVLTGVNITGGTVQATDTMLTAFGKLQNQINGLIGSTIYQGTWNAATNTPALASGVGVQGYYYIVSVAGTTNLDGITDWFVGDWAIFNGGVWQQVDNTDAVVSVNGQTGAVSLTTDNIPEGATNQYYLDSRARAALSFTAGSGAYNSTTGIITIPTNTSQLTNGANFITLASLSGTAPIVYSNITGAISITQSGTASDGYLSSTDWNTFNNKQATITLTTTGTSGAATLVGATLNIPQYQSALTNPVTGTGNANYIPKFTGTSAIANSVIYDNSGNILIGTGNITSAHKLTVYSATATAQIRAAGAAPAILFTNTDTNTNSYSGYVGIATAVNNFMAGTAAGDMVVQNYSGYPILFGIGNIIKMRLEASGQLVLTSTISNGTYTYTLPGATGTLALTSQIPSLTGYVPYTGATTSVDLGVYNLTSNLQYNKGIIVNKSSTTANSLNIEIAASASISGVGYISLTSIATDSLSVYFGGSTKVAILSGSSLSANRTYTLPDTSGTLALVGGSGIGTVTSVAALTIGTTGTDLSSTVANSTTTPVITLNVPTASAANRGALSAADWTTFNNKQSALTNPVTGTGTAGYVPKWTSGSAIGNSILQDSGTRLTMTSGDGFQISTGSSDTVGAGSFIALTNVGATNWQLQQMNAAYGLDWWTLASGGGWERRMVLTNPGNLIVGTTNTSTGHRLTVYSATETAQFRAAGAAPAIAFTNTDTNTNSYVGYLGMATAVNNFITGAAAGDFVLHNYSGGPILFGINNSEKVRIASSGLATFVGAISAGGNITGAYIFGSYFNASAGNSENPTIGQIWTQNTTDNYLRKSTPAHFRSQVTDGYYVPSTSQTTWNSSTVIGNVVGLLAWKNYGNNHVIFDASQSTSPSGTSVNSTNPSSNWVASYPTLMGWNGAGTYGVRVDSARVSDNTTGNAATATAAQNSSFLTQANATWGGRIQLGGDGGGGTALIAVVQSTNGNLHMDAGNGNSMYLNYYNNGIIYLNGATYNISSNGSQYNGNAASATTTTGNAGSVTYLPNRTDAAAYPVLWGAAYTNTIGTIAYSCAAVTIQSSTGTLQATNLYATLLATSRTSGDYRQATLGTLTGAGLYVTNVSAGNAYGLLVGSSYTYGDVWLQAGRADGNATPYNISLNASGGTVTVGTVTPQSGYDLTVSGAGYFSTNVTATRSYAAMAPTVSNGNWVTSFQATPVSAMAWGGDVSAGGPLGTWWFQVNMRHSNASNYWGTQLAYGWEDNANEIYQRNVTGGSYSGWVRYLNSNNYNLFALPLTGGNLSGTLTFSQPVGLGFANGQYVKDNGSGGFVIYGAALIQLNSNVQTSNYMLIGGNYTNNAYSSVSSTRLMFGGGDADAQGNYYIGTNLNNYGGNFTKLDLAWHTGIRMGAQPSYGGIRMFNTEDLSTQIFSVGETDNNVRVPYKLAVGTQTTTNQNLTVYSATGAGQVRIGGAAPTIYFTNVLTDPATYVGLLGLATSSNNFFTGTAAGDFVMYNSSSGYNLFVVNFSGGVYLTSGATSWTANSDIRLKNINSHIENAVEKLSTLQTINFSYKDDKFKKQNLGLIAQEVEKIFPELIDKNNDGMLGVRYTELVPVLIKAIQELKLEIETLKNK